MSPEERKTEGAKINALKDKVGESAFARKATLKEAALKTRLAAETLDVTLPTRAGGSRPAASIRSARRSTR